MEGLANRLGRLLNAGLVQPSEPRGAALLEQLLDVHTAIEDLGDTAIGNAAAARRQATRLCSKLWERAGELHAALDGADAVTTLFTMNAMAGALAVSAVAGVARAATVDHRCAYQVACAAAAVLSGPCTRCLRAMAAPPRAGAPAEAVPLFFGSQGAALLRALALLVPKDGPTGGHPAALEAFGRTSGRQLLPWLSAATDAVIALAQPARQAGFCAEGLSQFRTVCSEYSLVTDQLLSSQPQLDFVSASLAADQGLQARVVDALLCCLDSALLDADSEGADGDAEIDADSGEAAWVDATVHALRCLSCNELAPATHRLASQPGGAGVQRLLRLAGGALERAAAGSQLKPTTRAVMYLGGTKLVGSAGAAAQSAQGVAALLGTPPVYPFAGGEERLAEQVLRLAPHMLDGVKQMGAPEVVGVFPPDQALALCTIVGGCLALVARAPAGWDQLEPWCDTVDAGLRLVPQLLRMQAEGPPTRPLSVDAATLAGIRNGPHKLAETVFDLWHLVLCQLPSTVEGAPLSVSDALWRLHSRACRLACWCAAQPDAAAQLPALTAWRKALDPWVSTMRVARIMCSAAGKAARGAGDAELAARLDRRSACMSAAVCATLPVLGQHLRPSLGPLPIDVSNMLVIAAAGAPPPAPSEAAEQLAAALQACASEGAETRGAVAAWNELYSVADTAADSPCGCAQVLATGALQALLARAIRESLHVEGNAAVERHVALALRALCEACATLEMEAECTLALLGHAPPGFDAQEILATPHGCNSPACRALAAAGTACTSGAAYAAPAQRHVAALQAALPAEPYCPAGRREGFLKELAEFYAQRMLPAARQMADALLAYWAEPEPAAAAALELAQVAAIRSCAYLRCANLEGAGGPDAGTGAGSRRCSACRAVWYCGTACSHADWKAGHRRVCKVLAAARQAAQQAAAASG